MDKTLRKIVFHTQSNPICNVIDWDKYDKLAKANNLPELKELDERPLSYHKDIGPSLCLVKDEGAYLMSGSDEKIAKPNGEEGSLVAYAEGMSPADGWIGGDDFGENLPLDWFENIPNNATFSITTTDKEITIKVLGKVTN